MPKNDWQALGSEHGWQPPEASSLLMRLPVIRHVRAMMADAAVSREEALWVSLGRFPTGYDRWVVYGISRGWV